ncbi:MAG TPA: glycosyltransferase [Promineifilum sp.]|nr:glycosyltransferase [Promineifilum sp.]
MRVLFLVPYMPNAIRTRPYNLIRSLARNGHEITVLTLTQDAAEVADADMLRVEGIRVVARPLSRLRSLANSTAALVGREPLQAAYCWQSTLATDLSALLQSEIFDVVHVEHLRGARYGLRAKADLATLGLRTPVVWDSVDCISHLFRQAATHSTNRFRRYITRLELPRTERFEGELLNEFDQVLTSSPMDKEALQQLANGQYEVMTPIQVLPNGVDFNRFRPDETVSSEPDTLILTGKMSYHANITMAQFLVRGIMPHIWAKKPEVRVMIVGRTPAPEVRALAMDSRVTVTGSVPDIRLFLNQATVAVAPIVYNAGIQNKILEAMACGTPVVTTPAAVAGLGARSGEHLLVAEGAEALAEAALVLLESQEKRQVLSAAALAYVRKNHDWSIISEQLAVIYGSGKYP